MLTDHYQTLARGLPADVVRFVNLPLLELDGEPGALESWITRTQRVGDAGSVVGYTSWVGNASHSRSALAAHCFGVRLHRAHNLEENWGLTWTDPGHAQPHTPVFHALLALGLGSGTCSVYTACATEHWDARIDLDPDALRREGLDPAMYGRPYCPHTPLREDGTTTPNAVGLRMLRDFVRRHGPAFGGYRADIRLLIDLSAAEAGAWVQQRTRSRNVVLEVAELALDLMIQQQYQVDVITTHTSPSPAAEPDTPWIVLLGDPPDPEALDLVRERLGAGGRVLILSSASGPSVPLATTATAGRTTDAVLPHLPRPGHWHPATDDGLVLVHAGSTGRPSTVFALNPSGRDVVLRRSIAGQEICLGLTAGGSAAVVLDAEGAVGCLLANSAVGGHSACTPFLDAPRLRLVGDDARDVTAFRALGCWQITRHRDGGDEERDLPMTGMLFKAVPEAGGGRS